MPSPLRFVRMEASATAKIARRDVYKRQENNQSTVFTAFRGSKLSDEERAGAEHLMEMMLAARQQIMLRKALHHE